MEKMGKQRVQKHNRRHLTIIISFIFYVVIVGHNEALANKIDVLANDTVSMHCHTNAPIDIQWHFNSIDNFIYAGRMLRGPYLERFRTEYDNGTNYTLIIPSVRIEDAGWYYCSEEISGRRISSTHLTVLYSDPVCHSNMHPDGFIGPNTCNLQQENMVFNCVVSFNASSPPHLMWRLLNDTRPLKSSICDDKPNRRNCSLILNSDPKYDGSIFICQTTASIDSRFNCSTEAIKIQYISSTNDTSKKYVNVSDNVNCSSNSNLDIKYNWILTQNNKTAFLSSKQNLLIEKPGIYQCEVNYSIRNYSCLSIASVVNVSVESTNGGTTSGTTALAIVIPILLAFAVFSARIIIIWLRKRKRENKIENQRIRNKIEEMYKDFVSEVDPYYVLQPLIEKRIISVEDRANVLNKETKEDRCRALLDHLFSSSHREAFIVLRKAFSLRWYYQGIVARIDAADNNPVINESKQENERIRNRVVAIYEEFVSEVDPKKVLDILIQNKIVNIKQRHHHLKTKVTREEQCKALLDLLLFSCSKDNVFIILKEALKEHYPGIVERIDSLTIDDEDENNPNRRSKMLLESSIIVFGGFSAFKINLNRPNEVSALQKLPIGMNPYVAAAVYCGSVFVTGIGEHDDEIWSFDARNPKWNKCASLIRGRVNHSVAFVDCILYSCGGWYHGEIDDVEAYDAIDDKCSVVGNLNYAVHDSGNCVPYKASLYIFGGLNAQNEYVNSVQVYDTKLNSCTLLTNPMPRKEAVLRAALFENYVILLGQESCFLYNFDTETWELRDQFKTDVFWFAMTVQNEKLFVIGNRDSEDSDDSDSEDIYRNDVRFVPIVNVLNDKPIKWKQHAKLPNPLPVRAFGKLEFLVKHI